MSAAVVAALALAAGPASAQTPPRPYEGEMTFQAIDNASGPEEFGWTVVLGPGQQLVQVDERRAEVRHEDGTKAFDIVAGAAHDANGAAVPTTLRVSGHSIIVLVVHHRAGNPAAGGAPFAYPVLPGAGSEGDLQTPDTRVPPAVQPPSSPPVPERRCVVPNLVGRTVAADRRRLQRAGCKLGRVGGRRSRGARVAAQSHPAGTVLPAAARVHVRLASGWAG